ncbi:actin organization and endocytosis protein [Mortierella sp. 14UC]|nr:actin organization and endocytosis protein [Mortierella sp. 14UC]
MYNNINNQQIQQQQQQQQQQYQFQQQQFYQSAVGANFQYNAGFGQPLMQQQQYQYQQQQHQYQPARPGWAVSREEKAQYDQIFSAWDLDHSGYISGERAREIFGSSGLPPTDLGHIWALADPNNHGKLNKDEFAVAMHLVYRKLNGGDIPPVLPDDLVPPSTRDISETLDFVKKSLMSDIPSRAGTTNWGSYGSPSSQSSSTSLSKRLSVRSPDDVGYVSSARRGNVSGSPAPSFTRHIGSQETSVGRLQKEISEQRLILEATLSRASDPAGAGEDQEILDLKEQIRNAQSRRLVSSNESIHQRLRGGSEDLVRLREERRNMDQEVSDLLRTLSLLSSKVRETDKGLEESRLELAKLKSGGATSGDSGIIGTGPGGSITAEDRMKARIALMKAQRMAALTGKPIPSAAQAGIDSDQAARIRAERDVNEQNVSEIETAVRRLEDTMRQLERDLDNHARSQTRMSDNDRRKWEEGAGVESDIARRFIQEIKPPTWTIPVVSSYHSSSSASSRHFVSTPPQSFTARPAFSSSISSSTSKPSSPTISNVSLTGKTPEERRAIIRAQAERRLRDRQNDILSKTQSSRVEASSPSPAPAALEDDAFTSAKFEEAERLAREKLLANAESKRRQAEQERQAERDLKADKEKQDSLHAARHDERAELENRANLDAREQQEATERKSMEEQAAAQRRRAEELEQDRLAREQEEREERERKERFAQSTLAAKQQHQVSSPTSAQESSKKEPIRITLDSNPFAKHRKSISSDDDDWDTTSPVNATPFTAVLTANVAPSSSNNPFFRMMSSNAAPQSITHSKDTSDGWDVVEKEVDLADQLSQKLFPAAHPIPTAVAPSAPLAGSTIPLAPPSPIVAGIPVPPPPPPLSGAFPTPPSAPASGASGASVLLPASPSIPAPPPAPSGVPVPPPAPQAESAMSSPAASGARGALLNQIQSGIRLKKAVTNDKSGVKGIGRVLGEDSSAPQSLQDSQYAPTAHISSNSDQRPLGMPALGGLFAGGMPTLKKSIGITTGRVGVSTEVHDSRRESTDWFGRLASHPPTEASSGEGTPVTMPLIQDPATTSSVVAATSDLYHPSSPSQVSIQSKSNSAPSSQAEDSVEGKVDFDRGYRAKSLWAYSAGAPEELSFLADEYLRTFPSKEAGNTDWVYGISERSDSKKGWFPKTYVQQVEEKFKARALFAYAAQNKGELSVERGDIVDILEKPDPQWWKAQMSSTVTGMLPATYLEEYIEGQPLPEEHPVGQAKALYPYTGQSSEELSVEVGETVDIMNKPDPLWWQARNDQGNIGMLPSTYLEEVKVQSTIALVVDAEDGDSSDYESAEEHAMSSEFESSDPETLDSDDSESDNDSDSRITGSQDQQFKVIGANATSVVRAPLIAIAPTPRHRVPPPRPTGTAPAFSRSGQPSLSTSAPLKSSIPLRKQSEGSLRPLLSIPTDSISVMRQRSGSHPEVVPRSSSHSRLTSESQARQTPSRKFSIDRSPSPLLLTSPSWSASVGQDVSRFLSEKEMKRQEAIHELITTERVYLTYLCLVRDEFQRPLLDLGLIIPAESELFFKDWSSLLDLSRSIVDELMRRQESEQGVVFAVGDVINSHIVERVGCFMSYCANHREATSLLTQRMTDSRLLREFITNAKSKPSCRGMDMFSFLLQPLQRITRYPLLIKKILEYTDEDHIDHLLLTEALVSAESFLERINEFIRRGEDKQKLEDIQRRLTSGDLSEGLVLTSETRFLGPRMILQEGSLRKAKSGRRLYAYLCNDLLLLFVPGKASGALIKSASYASLSLSTNSASLSSSPSVISDWGQNNHGWMLYHAPMPLERVKVKADTTDETKFTIVVTSPVQQSTATQFSQVPLHLQSQRSSQDSPHHSMIHVRAASARERKAWLGAIQKAIEHLAKTPREYGMSTSIRPPLEKTIGTVTIRLNEAIIPSHEFAKSRSFVCTISLGDQLFTTRSSSTDYPFSGTFPILWRESTIFAIIDTNHSLNVKLKATSPFSPDGTSDDLIQTVVNLDTEVQAVKAQVYNKLLGNYGAFSEAFEYSLELKDKIHSLLEQTDNMVSRTADPESGLRQTVMSALVVHHEISHRVQENNAVLEGLKHFSRIEDILSQYEMFMDSGKILQAGHCIQQAAKALAYPPNGGVASSHITGTLSRQCTRMTEAIDQMLDELITNAIHYQFDDRNTRFKITISYTNEVPPLALLPSSVESTPGLIRWHELIRALMLLDVAQEKLRPLQKGLTRRLLQPLIQHHSSTVLQINNFESYTTAKESSIAIELIPGHGPGNLFGDVLSVFKFIKQSIFLNDYSSPEFNSEGVSSDTEILTHVLGRYIAKEACSLISKHHLALAVPKDIDGLRHFSSVASAARHLEDELIAMGFLAETDRELREFVENIDIHYTNNKRDALLKLGRAVIMSEDFKTIPVKDLDNDDALEKDGDDWGRIADSDTDIKESSVSVKAKQLVGMVLSTLYEAGSLSEIASPHLYRATCSLVDLYRALMPVHHARTLTTVPALSVLFYNDCLYVARELEKIPARLENGIPGMDEVQYDDIIPALRTLAKKWLDTQVHKQRQELMQSIEDANEFQDSGVDSNYETYERSMKQVVLVFKHLGKAWKPVLSPMTFYKVLGQLLDEVSKRVIKELEELTDISEKESHKLAALFGLLFECEDLFDSAGLLVKAAMGDAFEDEVSFDN